MKDIQSRINTYISYMESANQSKPRKNPARRKSKLDRMREEIFSRYGKKSLRAIKAWLATQGVTVSHTAISRFVKSRLGGSNR